MPTFTLFFLPMQACIREIGEGRSGQKSAVSNSNKQKYWKVVGLMPNVIFTFFSHGLVFMVGDI